MNELTPEQAQRVRRLLNPPDPEAVAEFVASAPDLTEEQAARLCRLFRYLPAPEFDDA